jgi:crossover junction endodeoxyribonuclease RuvC
MIILGIDPGIADTGFGLIEDTKGQLKVLTFGSIKTKAGLPLAQRLAELYQQLQKIIKDYQPQTAAIEQLFFCNNAKTALIVGQARGVAMLTCQQAGLAIFEFTPLQVKQAVATYGGASKLQVQKMVQMILGLKEIPKPDDAADALAIAICGLNSFNLSNLDKLRKKG